MIFVLALAFAADPALSMMVLDHPDRDTPRRFDLSTAKASLEVGEAFFEGTLSVASDPTRVDRITVELRYLSLATLSMEGPTWPLPSLGQGTTGWTALPTASGGYALPNWPSDADLAKGFPEVDAATLNKAIHARLEGQVTEIPSCTSVVTSPCGLAASTAEIRVRGFKGPEQVEEHVVAIRVPTGC